MIYKSCLSEDSFCVWSLKDAVEGSDRGYIDLRGEGGEREPSGVTGWSLLPLRQTGPQSESETPPDSTSDLRPQTSEKYSQSCRGH